MSRTNLIPRGLWSTLLSRVWQPVQQVLHAAGLTQIVAQGPGWPVRLGESTGVGAPKEKWLRWERRGPAENCSRRRKGYIEEQESGISAQDFSHTAALSSEHNTIKQSPAICTPINLPSS